MTPFTPPTTEQEAAYRALLHKHLSHLPASEIDFFINSRRFAILDSEIGEVLRKPGARILNVAGGPFALEFYQLGRNARVRSLDLDPALEALHADLVAEGLIADSVHTTTDVHNFDTSMRYDVVIINDLLYHASLDFEAVLKRYRKFVRADGILYFDLLDAKAGPIWRAFKKDSRYRRYDMDAVRETLDDAGFEVESQRPSLGIKGGVDGIARRALWHGFGIANNHIFRARRRNILAGWFVAITGALASAYDHSKWWMAEAMIAII